MPWEVAIEKRGEKLLINSISRNKVPTEYLSISKNARVKDSTVTKRKWYKTVLENSTWTNNKWITYNKELFVATDSKFQQVDLTAWTLTSKWSIGVDTVVNFVNYWKYTLIFTGSGYPYYYDWTTLTQTTSTVCPNVNPIIADRFTWFTFMSGNTADKENVLYISRPITEANQSYCYDWVGSNSEQITFDSKILWLAATLNQLFIFTENRVEYVGKDSLQTIWGVATLISTPIGDWGQLASYRSVVAAGDKVFYLTKNNTINTLNYAEWTVEPAIGILTDEPVFKITKYLDKLDEDQSESFGWFNNHDKTIHWSLKTEWALYNDTILIYDIANGTWTTDTKKFYSDVTSAGDKLYAGSAISANIIQDNVWLNDDDAPIEFEIQDTDISLWTIREKLFQWWITSWWLNRLTNLEITTYIDDWAEAYTTIDWDDFFGETVSDEEWTIWGVELWWVAIWWSSDYDEEDNFVQFDLAIDHWNLYTRGKRIKRKIIENSLGSDFYLDKYVVLADVTGNIQLSDKA